MNFSGIKRHVNMHAVAFVMTAALWLPGSTQAALISTLENIDIEGVLYNITFHTDPGFRTFNQIWDADGDGIFGGSTSLFDAAPTFWGNESGARSAATAIMAALGTGDWTIDQSVAGGGVAPFAQFDGFLVPFSGTSGALTLTGGLDSIRSINDTDVTLGTDVLTSTGSALILGDSQDNINGGQPYASFTVAVPAPAPLVLMLLAGALRWRLNRRAEL